MGVLYKLKTSTKYLCLIFFNSLQNKKKYFFQSGKPQKDICYLQSIKPKSLIIGENKEGKFIVSIILLFYIKN